VGQAIGARHIARIPGNRCYTAIQRLANLRNDEGSQITPRQRPIEVQGSALAGRPLAAAGARSTLAYSQ
jgi:hypothetical protein